MIFFLLRECITPGPKNQSPGHKSCNPLLPMPEPSPFKTVLPVQTPPFVTCGDCIPRPGDVIMRNQFHHGSCWFDKFQPLTYNRKAIQLQRNRRRHDTFFGADLRPDAAGRRHSAVRYCPHRPDPEHPLHSAAAGGHSDGVHRRRDGGPHRRRGHRRHRHRQLEHMAAPRHPRRAVHSIFHPPSTSGPTASRMPGACCGRLCFST